MSSRQASKAARQNPAYAASATSPKVVEPPKSDVSVLRNELPSYFEKLKNLCYETVQQEDQVETGLVEGTSAARWRIDRSKLANTEATLVLLLRPESSYARMKTLDRLRYREVIQNLRNDPKSAEQALVPPLSEHSEPPRTKIYETTLNMPKRHWSAHDPNTAESATSEILLNDPNPAESTQLPPLSEHREPAPNQNLRNDPNPLHRAPEPLGITTIKEPPQPQEISEAREPTPKT